jgi:NADH-quinone oxidoreductase subunit L
MTVTPGMPPFWLIPLIPLAGAIVNGVLNRRLPKPAVSLVACGTVFAAFVLAVVSVAALLRLDPAARSVEVELFPWIVSGDFAAPFGFRLDQLSAVMILIVTGVGFLIHVYSVGYMSHDRGYQRYFSYLNLFTASMLLLVLANNYLLLFVGWEGVGVCSYLLIGFWFDRKSAADAGKKAFLVNRIGDFGFLLGLLLLFLTFHSVRYGDVFAAASTASTATLTTITLLLFVGATGKSAQIPLYVWLPDAMEGPTPVSALIHAATMVTAGVYMVARSAALYVLAPASLAVVAGIGIATAIFAASIGLVQTDIKRVLAYSTVSQLGYMFAACGVGAFWAGIFHVMTHAFFKALLFLGAGSVIHALSGEQDMRKMGALRSKLPWTHLTMLIGTLAIAGIPPLAGFVSKDAILGEAFLSGHRIVWIIGLITACMTAFYMFRLLILTFYGESRADHHAAGHLHESPPSMLLPLFVLAVLSVVGGWIGLPAMLGMDRFQRFIAPVFPRAHEAGAAESTEWMLMVISVAAAVLGILIAVAAYRRRGELAAQIAAKLHALYTTLLHKWYVDEIYDALVVAPLRGFAAFFASFFDVWVVDGIVNGVGLLVRGWSAGLRRVQSGQVAVYAGVFLIGVVWLISYALR